MDASESRLDALRDRLVRDGMAQLAVPPVPVRFTHNPRANDLLNDLAGHPHAFVLACLMDRQIRADRAWLIPWLVREHVGSFEMSDLLMLDDDDWLALLQGPPAVHRLPQTMAIVLQRGVARIASVYSGDASRIWADSPPSARVVRRFLEFRGAGPKIATMAANILVRDFHVPLGDHRYIDISPDVQVQRVMARLGLVEEGAGPDVVIYAARELNPDFPGVFDGALWDIGQRLCRPHNPGCGECPLGDICPSSTAPAA